MVFVKLRPPACTQTPYPVLVRAGLLAPVANIEPPSMNAFRPRKGAIVTPVWQLTTVPDVRQVPSILLAFPCPDAGIRAAATNRMIARAATEIAFKDILFMFISFQI